MLKSNKCFLLVKHKFLLFTILSLLFISSITSNKNKKVDEDEEDYEDDSEYGDDSVESGNIFFVNSN
jgi:hypothetical protein